MGEALEAAESVEGFQVHYDEGALNKLTETIAEGEKLGLAWGQYDEEE
jgi:hypothetical protein